MDKNFQPTGEFWAEFSNVTDRVTDPITDPAWIHHAWNRGYAKAPHGSDERTRENYALGEVEACARLREQAAGLVELPVIAEDYVQGTDKTEFQVEKDFFVSNFGPLKFRIVQAKATDPYAPGWEYTVQSETPDEDGDNLWANFSTRIEAVKFAIDMLNTKGNRSPSTSKLKRFSGSDTVAPDLGVYGAQVFEGTTLIIMLEPDEEGTYYMGLVDLKPIMVGPVYDEIFEKGLFERFAVEDGTLVWPNGADIAPERFYEAVMTPLQDL